MLIRSVNLFGGDFMSKVVNGRIILDKEESKEFLKDIFHPDVEALKKRDAFIGDTKNWTVQRLGNGRTIIDIPDLELPSMSTVDISDNLFVEYSKQDSSDVTVKISASDTFPQYDNINSDHSKIEHTLIESIFILIPKLEYHTPFTNSNFSPLGFHKVNSMNRSVYNNV